MFDKLRERVTEYLTQNKICFFGTNGSEGAWAVIAQYQNQGLELDCRVPRWSDALYHLEQDPHALVIVLDEKSGHSRWLEYRGIARIDELSTDERYATVHLTPERVDLIDETRDWGARETLEL